MAPQRRRRNKIPKGEAVFVCNVLQNGVLVPFPPPPADKGKGKAVVEAGSGFDEYMYPDEVTAQLDPPKSHKSLGKLPKYGKPCKMFSWTVEEYLQYDEYLIAKWDIYGFDPCDETYVSIRDPKSKVVRVAREVYNV